MAKRAVSELIRLAMIFAIQDRESFADCYPEDAPERAEALAMASEFRAYKKKRFGRDNFARQEEMIAAATPVSIFDLKESHEPDEPDAT